MAKIKFREWTPSNKLTDRQKVNGETLSPAEKVEKIVSIVREYQNQDLVLTARQLYYQFVARALIPNTERSYKNFTGLVADARYAGLVDWNAIEDRGRVAATPRQWDGLTSLVDAAVRGYRLPRWEGQNCYVELWVEKQALAGVLELMSNEFHVTLMVNKGYSSASAMFEASRRFRQELQRANGPHEAVLLYLGDHDPSGEDMVRDIRDRLREFGVSRIDVRKLALTMEQVQEYNPPPNPAKTTDSRFARYEERHGDESWEVDALPPDVLQQIIRDAFDTLIERAPMDGVIAREERDKNRLREAVRQLTDGEDE